MEWNDTDGEERKYLKKNLSEWHFVKHKSHTNWPRIDTGLKTKINIYCVQRSSPYRAVNTLRLLYKPVS